jgi:hypothetical protein
MVDTMCKIASCFEGIYCLHLHNIPRYHDINFQCYEKSSLFKVNY